jgi:hypothetical protein
MYHRMYLRRCSMSSISEESETGDDDQVDEEFMVKNNKNINQQPINLNVENCLGDLNTFKEVRFFLYSVLFPVDRSITFFEL